MPLKIYYLDDEPDLLEIFTDTFSSDSIKVTTFSDALPAIDAAFPSFGALIRRIGSRQIRNVGTLAGNLGTASPIGDTLPCLRKGWAFWVPAASLNFVLVPLPYQVLYMSTCSIVWTAILSAASSAA